LALQVKLNNYNTKEENEATERVRLFFFFFFINQAKNMMRCGDSFGSGASLYSPTINLDK